MSSVVVVSACLWPKDPAYSFRNIAVDPASWGYRLTGSSELEAIVPHDAFQLHILGSDKGKVPIPVLLNGTVVQLHPGTTYEEYYAVLQGMVS